MAAKRKRAGCLIGLIGLVMVLAGGNVAAVAAQEEAMRTGLINLDHLLFLTEPVHFGGQPMAIVLIYSEYPGTNGWMRRAGISAVDDVARAALVYLGIFYEQTGDMRALEQARLCLDFALPRTMTARFTTSCTTAGTINTQGSTSYKSLGWWAVRNVGAGRGYRVFGDVDPAYAVELQVSYRLTESALAAAHGRHYAGATWACASPPGFPTAQPMKRRWHCWR